MSRKVVSGCKVCGLPEKDQHSLRESAIHDYLLSKGLTYESAQGQEAIEILRAGKRIV